jgi:hypothetical protein
MRPYGFASYYDTFKATMDHRTCEQSFWPGQSKALLDLLTASKTLVTFSESDGADLHCEPQAFGLRDLHVFDWLDETLGRL